ncbi:hypothetical protein [uncultured Muribaculum sp.]|uniref:hypothetical protein n=1 Tax=uncultured Muribaculum sp. TaxID=1918613 RepID=UPI0025B792CD|nr:hypothetical protein [uncultured Muribaculum sp.]
MNKNIDDLIKLSYEIEGLLHIVRDRGGQHPGQVTDMLSEKTALLYNATISGFCKHEQEEETPAHTPEPEITTEPDNETPVETTNSDNEPETNPILVTETDIEFVPETEIDNKEEIVDYYDIAENNGPDPETETPAVSPAEAAQTTQQEAPTEPIAPEQVTLDEKLAREQSRCLKKAFSLNDRFRFKRELFGNSDSDFTDTINLIEAMATLSEATEYFYEDLEWDPENAEVIDFMQIITKHFQGR